MTHERVDSKNIHSVAHENNVLEVRFNCGGCKGSGRKVDSEKPPGQRVYKCERCDGSGHTGTYVYSNVPPEVFHKVMGGEAVEGQDKRSIGAAFDKHIKKGSYPWAKRKGK